jgi:hypothetical protein
MQIPRYFHKTQDDKVVQMAPSSLLRVVIVLSILSYPALVTRGGGFRFSNGIDTPEERFIIALFFHLSVAFGSLKPYASFYDRPKLRQIDYGKSEGERL